MMNMLVNTWNTRKQSFCKENQYLTYLLEVLETYDSGDLLDIYSSPKDLKNKQQKMGNKIEGNLKNELFI